MSNFSIDFISPEITLFYRGKENHSSFFSKILSCIILSIIISLIIFLSLDFILKLNPNIFEYSTYINNIISISFNKSGLFHFVNIYSLNSSFLDYRAFQIIGVEVNDKIFSAKNGNITEFNHWIYYKCNNNEIGGFKEKINGFREYYNNYSFCIEKMYNLELNRTVNKEEKEFRYPLITNGSSYSGGNVYGIYIMKCQNNSLNKHCYNNEKINEYFNYLYFYSICFIDNYVSINNFNKPFTPFIHLISSSFNKNSFNYNHLNFHQLQMNTYTGIIFEKKTIHTSHIFYHNEQITINDINQYILGNFYFWMQNKEDIYYRTYKKLPDISGNIIGIIEVIMLIVKLVNYILFNEFKVLKDFNFELSQNLNFNEKGNLFSFNTYRQKNTSNFNSRLSKSKYSKKDISSINNFINKSHPVRLNLNESNYTKNIISKYKNLSQGEYFLGLIHIKKNRYVKLLQKQRENIISEENMIKNYFFYKNLQKIIGNKKFNVMLNFLKNDDYFQN